MVESEYLKDMTMLNKSNLTSYCFNILNSGEKFLTAWQTDVLLALYIMFWLGNFFANSLVMALLVKTKQLSNCSYKFLFLLTFSDVCIAIFTQPFEIIKTSNVSLYIPCKVTLLLDISSRVFPRISAYTIGLIAFDRYVRIEYPFTFERILTSYRASILMTGTCALAVFNSIMTFAGCFKKKEIIFRLVALSTELTFFIISVVLQVKTIFILNRRRVATDDNIHTSNDINGKAAKLFSRIVKLVVICMVPAVAAATVRSILARKLHGSSLLHVEFLLRLALLGSYVNSIGNAGLFLTMNTPSTAYLKLKLQGITNRKPKIHFQSNSNDR